MSSRPSSYPTATEASTYPLSTFYSSSNAISNTGICTGTNNGIIAIAISEISGPTSNQAAASASLYTNGNPFGVEIPDSTSEQAPLITRWSCANVSLLWQKLIQYCRHGWLIFTFVKNNPIAILIDIIGIPAWQGLQIQTWTSQKDFLEYCNAELSSLVGSAWQDCNAAIKAGLLPPPGHVARVTRALKRSLELIMRRIPIITRPYTQYEPISGHYQSLDAFFVFWSQHLVLVWFVWWAVFTCGIALARISWRKVSRRLKSGHNNKCWLILICFVIAGSLVALICFIDLEHVHWLRVQEQEARYAFDKYSESLPAENLSVETEQRTSRLVTQSDGPRSVSSEARFSLIGVLLAVSGTIAAACCSSAMLRKTLLALPIVRGTVRDRRI
ncbi:hypothetical protein HBH56_152460 [Parastagonospora nodorum]|uniref:Uncharacterized protein n=1 Tax=Phaeosphaeria nodorum (strain SN15 / ATCC MYA-4574 / FGSC 10173) TaxID=321614 RepID=A0A7U2HY11_PHANO|nr:hypothetical protein HBH56_152460 [Parastagonospora nodorum]QRC96090.1 hypothetical protein JI435_304050 [Parastagonospora nodorum SN15]KAH3926599.1 hypothetical protein HBH54_165220 [Parastagonospora nodorum]KAH3940321.1 hypothetical protein HBH53_218160 [Parastagonospora nodorum]KAH3970257.1 hypothetical protein HBH52_165650 [Parastagonospora nodorum]